MPTPDEKNEFLEKDLRDALRWLFVNSVVWHVSENRPERLPAMCTAFVQARALYEFYYANGKGDDARARHFADSWTESPSNLYLKYMAARTPAEKRVFHLVYGRSKAANAGGPGHEGPDHLKNQVLKFAKDLLRITEKFVICVRPEFRDLVQAPWTTRSSRPKGRRIYAASQIHYREPEPRICQTETSTVWSSDAAKRDSLFQCDNSR